MPLPPQMHYGGPDAAVVFDDPCPGSKAFQTEVFEHAGHGAQQHTQRVG